MIHTAITFAVMDAALKSYFCLARPCLANAVSEWPFGKDKDGISMDLKYPCQIMPPQLKKLACITGNTHEH